MKPSKKVAIIALIVGIGVFGYSQYLSASQIGVTITDSQLLGQDERGQTYNLELEFTNPSLLVLTAGQTEFTITADDHRIGDGTLEPFVLPAMDRASVQGTFVADSKSDSDNTPQVQISGITKYNVLFTSIDVPFVYYPTEDQARAFIHQN